MMIAAPTRRAALLAAMALVIAAGHEPVSALRRLASEDPNLGGLRRIAADLELGHALTTAMMRAGLLSVRQAQTLSAASPADLGTALGQIANGTVYPPNGELLRAWFPVWVVVTATLPWLIISGLVALFAAAAYAGPVTMLSLDNQIESSHWLFDAMLFCLSAGVIAGGWWMLRRVRWLRAITWLSSDSERTARLARLLRHAQAPVMDNAWRDDWRTWAWLAGASTEAAAALAESGGQPATAMIALGVVSRAADGQPDWATAQRDADAAQAQALLTLRPVLIAVLMLACILGFMGSGMYGEFFTLFRQLI